MKRLSAVLLLLVPIPVLAAWGLRQDRLTDAWQVVSGPRVRSSEAFGARPRGAPPPEGFVIEVLCDPEHPVRIGHRQHAGGGDHSLRIRAGDAQFLDLGSGRLLTREEFLPFLRGKRLVAEVWPDGASAPRFHEEDLLAFRGLWKRALEKQGCWRPSDWPVR